jgi:hypothetical protein
LISIAEAIFALNAVRTQPDRPCGFRYRASRRISVMARKWGGMVALDAGECAGCIEVDLMQGPEAGGGGKGDAGEQRGHNSSHGAPAIKTVRESAQRSLPAPNRPADRVRAWQA